MLQYKVMEIFTSEESQWQGKALFRAIVEHVSSLKIASRCMVTRGIEGAYENGEIATGRLEVLSYNMPVRITVIVPAVDFDQVLSIAEKMVTDGIIAAHDVDVISHKTRGMLIPRHTRVREIMTPAPKTVAPTTPLSEVARLTALFHFYRPSRGRRREPPGWGHSAGRPGLQGRHAHATGSLGRIGPRESECCAASPGDRRSTRLRHPHENLGDVYARLASQSYEQAVKLNPQSRAAAAKLGLARVLVNYSPPKKPAAASPK